MNNIPWFDIPIGFSLLADQVSTQNAKMSKNCGQKHENMTKYKVVMIVYLYAHP